MHHVAPLKTESSLILEADFERFPGLAAPDRGLFNSNELSFPGARLMTFRDMIYAKQLLLSNATDTTSRGKKSWVRVGLVHSAVGDACKHGRGVG